MEVRKKLFALLIVVVGILISGYYLYLQTSFVEMLQYRKKVKTPLWLSTKKDRTSHNYIAFKDVLDVQSFVFFTGYPRSSHSILASLIDSHPNAIIAHEFNLFPKLNKRENLLTNRTLLYDALYQNSRHQSTQGWRSDKHTFHSKGYSLQLNNSWQGHFRCLRVIGDKSGGITARMFRDNRTVFTQLYHDLTRLVKVPLKVIHVVRNPYDMIATRLLYRVSEVSGQKAKYSAQNPLNSTSVHQALKGLYGEAKAVLDMSQVLNLSVLEVHSADFVNSPKGEMRKVCKFLGLQCSSWYLDEIARSMYKSVSITRQSIFWSNGARNFMNTQILSLPFFKRYSFDSPF